VNGNTSVNYDLTNRFLYDEYINAAYLNYNKSFSRWELQSGLRLESTIMKGNQLGNAQKQGSKFDRDYLSLFPTFFAQYKLDSVGKHTLGFNYGRRIDRPNFDFLNPFVSPLDKFTFYTGNPFLVPTFSNNFTLSYDFLNFSYSFSKDGIAETLEIDKYGKYFSRPNNLNRTDVFSVDATIPIPITKKINANIYTEVGRMKITSPLYTEQVDWARNYAVFQGNVQFQLPKSTVFEMSGNYQSNIIHGQLLIKSFGVMNLSLQKKILKNKGSLRLNANDIFYTRRADGIINNLRRTEADWNSRLDSRQFAIAFSYNFGKASKAKERYNATGSENEQKRAQG
jgi:hypothetical protein